MKTLLRVGLLCLSVVGSSLSGATLSANQGRDAGPGGNDRLIGAWRLAWLEEEGAGGSVQRANCSGMLVFTSDGHMSVQVMYRDQQTSGKADSVQYAQGGYEASYGTFQVKDAGTFTYHVDGALVRTLIGKDLTRIYEFSGNQMIVKSSNPKERWRVAWERD